MTNGGDSGIVTTVDAGIAHLVERHLAKVEVASSSLVARSIYRSPKRVACFLLLCFLQQNSLPPPSRAPKGARIINQRTVGVLRMAERRSRDAGKRVRASASSQAPYPSLPAEAASSLIPLLVLFPRDPLRWARAGVLFAPFTGHPRGWPVFYFPEKESLFREVWQIVGAANGRPHSFLCR